MAWPRAALNSPGESPVMDVQRRRPPSLDIVAVKVWLRPMPVLARLKLRRLSSRRRLESLLALVLEHSQHVDAHCLSAHKL